LRAAAPYQKRRSRQDVAIAIEDSDIREKIREKRIGNFIVFVVERTNIYKYLVILSKEV